MNSPAVLERPRTEPRAFSPRRRAGGARLVIPAGLSAGAVSAVGAENPLAGLGVAGLAIMSILPWTALFICLVAAAIGNRWGVEVSGASLRLAQAIMIPFAIRAVLFTRPDLRPRWKAPEWILIGFVLVNFMSTYFFARVKTSELGALIELLGVITYLSVYMSVVTPDRLRKASRIFLFLGAMDALIGVMSFLGYYVGLSFGVDKRYVPAFNGAPAIKGIAYEHDIFGSTCAAVAIAFLVLMRENSSLFSKKWTERFFWLSLFGMIVSQARGAWIGFTLVFIAYYVVGVRRRRVIRLPRMLRTTAIVVFLGFLGVGALYFTSQQSSTAAPSPVEGLVITGGQKILSAINPTATCDGCATGTGRLRRWTKGVNEVMTSSPVIGLGTDSYGLRNFRPSPFTWPYLAPAYIESLYVRTLYDTGVIGLLLLVGFFVILLWPRKELQHSPGDLAPLARALGFGGLTLAASYAITDSTLLIWPWIMFGLARAAMVLATRQARDVRGMGAQGGSGGGSGLESGPGSGPGLAPGVRPNGIHALSPNGGAVPGLTGVAPSGASSSIWNGGGNGRPLVR